MSKKIRWQGQKGFHERRTRYNSMEFRGSRVTERERERERERKMRVKERRKELESIY